MKKILTTIFLLTTTINLFAFSIDSIDFEATVKENEIKEKEFTITNKGKENLKYTFSTDKDNVTVTPKSFIIMPDKSKKFTVKLKGAGTKGDNYYYLIIREHPMIKRDPNKKSGATLILDKVIKIEQKYILE